MAPPGNSLFPYRNGLFPLAFMLLFREGEELL